MKKIKRIWPLPGGTRNYVTNLFRILSVLNENHFDEARLISWMMKQYSLQSPSTTRGYIDVIKKIGVVDIKGGFFVVNNHGKHFLETKDNFIILKLLIKNIFGFQQILKLLAEEQTLDRTEIHKEIENIYHMGWKTDAQIGWRLYWLLSLEFVEVTSGKYYLTEKGLSALNEILKIQIAKRPEAPRKVERKLDKLSHSDLEDKMKYIGDFFEFEAIKRPSINLMLPKERRLRSSKKELDGIWIKKIAMGGRIYYPIEIQIGGNLSDTIDRLEIVSDFAQKVIVVVDEEQEKIMLERLEAKRSKVLDKIIFIRPQDTYKMVSATNALKGFFEKIFH